MLDVRRQAISGQLVHIATLGTSDNDSHRTPVSSEKYVNMDRHDEVARYAMPCATSVLCMHGGTVQKIKPGYIRRPLECCGLARESIRVERVRVERGHMPIAQK